MGIEIEEEDFDEARELRRGWCADCEDFTISGVELEAVCQECIDCGGFSVFGAVHAKRAGFITVEREVLR